MLLIPLSDPAGVGGWHCPPYPERLLQTKNKQSISKEMNNDIFILTTEIYIAGVKIQAKFATGC